MFANGGTHGMTNRLRGYTRQKRLGNTALDEHIQHVRQVLHLLLENQLFCNAEKFEFHKTTIQFLGFDVSRGHLEMDYAKAKAVTQWHTPVSREKLQRLLGFANLQSKQLCI